MKYQTTITRSYVPQTPQAHLGWNLILRQAARMHCEHEHVQSAFESQGEDVIEYLACADCGKDLRGELPELSPAELADQLAEREE
jgi:hypothetical protein